MKVLLALVTLVPLVGAASWSYAAVDEWKDKCDGKSQSPIDIQSRDAKVDKALGESKLEMLRYKGKIAGKVDNNGHTVKFGINSKVAIDKRPAIKGAGLPGEFYFEQMHFHWGNCDSNECHGSEHTVNGKAAPAEVHFVHVNKKYATIGDALSHDDGLAVLGLLFEVVEDEKEVKTTYSQFASLIDKIKKQGSSASASIGLRKLYPESVRKGKATFYRYQGSLTTPPCSEVVTWTVYAEPVPISKSTLELLMKATMKDGDTVESITNNYRPVMPRNGREVKVSQEIKNHPEGNAPPKTQWSYDDKEDWTGVCQGESQSPIDVVTDEVTSDKALSEDPLKFHKYDKETKGTFSNNGHTVVYSIDEKIKAADRPQISKGGFGNNTYIFAQLHFHWGSCADEGCAGSEHKVDGKSGEAEVHFVHVNSKYATIIDALRHQDGLAVIGFNFKVTDDDSSIKTKYGDLAKLVPKVKNQGDKTDTSLTLSSLIPEGVMNNKEYFFRYQGSLTTPPCSEVVTWTLFETMFPISKTTLESFLGAQLEDHSTHKKKAITDNYRSTQPLNLRVVKTSNPGVASESRNLAGKTTTKKTSGANRVLQSSCGLAAVSTMAAAAARI